MCYCLQDATLLREYTGQVVVGIGSVRVGVDRDLVTSDHLVCFSQILQSRSKIVLCGGVARSDG